MQHGALTFVRAFSTTIWCKIDSTSWGLIDFSRKEIKTLLESFLFLVRRLFLSIPKWFKTFWSFFPKYLWLVHKISYIIIPVKFHRINVSLLRRWIILLIFPKYLNKISFFPLSFPPSACYGILGEKCRLVI